MNIDRRTFLALGAGVSAGGAIGTLFTPLPWKLMDDAAIWTQNWPWTPDPAGGEVSYEDTVCTLCPGACGVSVRKAAERPVKIEGLGGYPVNDGGICPVGAAGLQMLYGPSRIRTPLARAGKRGQGKWMIITWEEAIREVSARLAELRKTNRAHTVGAVIGNRHGSIPALFQRFFTTYGSSNLFAQPTAWDTYSEAMKLMQGVDAPPAFDLANSDFIVSFGAGLIEGWGAPVSNIQVNSKWSDNHAKVVQIEPRLSNTAAKAGEWIAPKPGTEAALALGMAHVLITDNTYKHPFVKWYATGFEDFKPNPFGPMVKGFKSVVLENYSPAQVEAITGVDKNKITALARAFAKAKAPIALYGRGKASTPGALRDCMAIHALNAMMGVINKPGGVSALPTDMAFDWPKAAMDRVSNQGFNKKTIDGLQPDRNPLRNLAQVHASEALSRPSDYDLSMLMVWGADPAYTLPDAGAARKALEKIPFIVSFASQMDDTAHMADIILPDHVYLEALRDVPSPPGFGRPLAGLCRPVVEPVYKSKNTGDTLIELAKAIEGPVAESFPWDSYEDCLKEGMAAKWDTFEENGYIQQTESSPIAWAKAFFTSHKRFDFSPTAKGPRMAQRAIVQPGYEKVEPAGDPKKLPLVAIPYDNLRLSEGAVGDPPFVVKSLPDTALANKNELVVQVHPKTARAHALKDKKSAVLVTELGRVPVTVSVSTGIAPNVIGVPRGLGHTGYSESLRGKGANYNVLAGPVEDPVTGFNMAWGIRARLIAA